MLDLELLLVIVFMLFLHLGFVYAVIAGYTYVRFEKGSEPAYVPVAIAAMAVHYLCVFGASASQEHLVPSLLLFVAAVALIVAIWLGLKARTGAGTRVAFAAFATIAAYGFFVGASYCKVSKFHFGR